jgi:hypothetical protein
MEYILGEKVVMAFREGGLKGCSFLPIATGQTASQHQHCFQLSTGNFLHVLAFRDIPIFGDSAVLVIVEVSRVLDLGGAGAGCHAVCIGVL